MNAVVGNVIVPPSSNHPSDCDCVACEDEALREMDDECKAPGDFVTQAVALLDALYAPKFADLRARCAEAAMKAAPLGPLAVRAAVTAVELEVGK